MADFAARYLSEIESGKGFGAAGKTAAAGTMKGIGKTFEKENVVRAAFGGEDILSAYIRGKLGVKKKPGKEKEPTKVGGAEGEGGFSSEGAGFLKIIAKNSMTLPGIARDMNVLRQNVVKLVKLKGGEARNAADAYFLKQNEREKAVEAQQAKQGKVTPAAATKKEDGGGLLAKLIEGFFIFLFAKKLIGVLKEIFSPKALMSVFKKVFLPLAIIGTLFNGITDGFKRYKESGSFTEAIVAGLGSMLSFLTFGIFGEDTLTKLFKSISDFFSPITDTISNIFNGIKDFFKGLFGIKTEDKGPKDLAKVNPEMPDPSKFASGAAKASGASDEKAADIGGLFGAVGKGDVKGLFGKAQEFAAKYPEPAATPTSPTPMSSEGVPLDQAQRNYELNKRLTGEASKALGTPLEFNTPAPKAAAPTPAPIESVQKSPAPAPTSGEDPEISALEGKIIDLETDIRNGKKMIERRKKHMSNPNISAEAKQTYAQANEASAQGVAENEAELEQAKKQLAEKKKAKGGAQASAAPAAATAGAAGGGGGGSVSAGGGGGGGGSVSSGGGGGGSTPSMDAGGGSTTSGSDVSSASTAVAEGQRMESAADMGSVVNSPTTNNSSSSQGKAKPPTAEAYDSDLAKVLLRA